MSSTTVKLMCAAALCVVLACYVQEANSQYYNYGGDGNAFWRSTWRRYWQTQTRVTTTYRSCGGVQYDTVRTVCCSGRIMPRLGGCGCCGRNVYQVENRMCCGGSVTYRRQGYNSCCGTHGFNSNYYSCRGNSIVSSGFNNYNNYS